MKSAKQVFQIVRIVFSFTDNRCNLQEHQQTKLGQYNAKDSISQKYSASGVTEIGACSKTS